MNYHNITCPDMNNGDGLRVVLWLSGCSHHCKGCQNPQTWNSESGILFDNDAKQELFDDLEKDYISGITFSGGDPLFYKNIIPVLHLCMEIRSIYGTNKTIWLYTGYTFEEILNSDNRNMKRVLVNTDVLVDGKYQEDLRNIELPWVGSSNQRVIDVQASLKHNKIIGIKNE